MEIFEPKNREGWNEFVAANSSPSAFQQSWEWGEFQKACGHKVYRLKIAEILTAQIVVKSLPLGRAYLEISHGPIIAPSFDSSPLVGPACGTDREERWGGILIQKLKEISKKENAIMVRMSPPYEEGFAGFPKNINWQVPEILIHQKEPDETILVDLSRPKEEMLEKMHEKSRYNIRLAGKKGVSVRDGTCDEKAFEKFLDLLKETSARDQITLWPESRFRKFRESFLIHNSPSPSLTLREGTPPFKVRGGGEELLPRAILLVGELDGKILAGAIVMLFGDAGTYLYAGSTRENSPANAPSLVLWEAILATQKAGKRWYDMWGIAPANDPNHPWAGITRFKTRYIKAGETGKEIHFAGTRDYIFDKKIYTLFKIGKKILGR